MRKILMLDLEGVIIASANPPLNRRNPPDYGVRPYAKEFVERCCTLFDEIYLNTCAVEAKARKVMKEAFGNESIGYYPSDLFSKYGKADNYEQFLGSLLIHVEDMPHDNHEAKRIIELGFHFIPVKSWCIMDAFLEENKKEAENDRELLDVLKKIELIIH